MNLNQTKWLALSCISILSVHANAGDMFADGALRDIPQQKRLTADDTVGGYTIYPGDGQWVFSQGTTRDTTGPSTIPVRLGKTTWLHWENGVLFARMDLTANLNQSSESRAWRINPCGGDHLVAVNKPRGREDHCMTIDPVYHKVGSKDVTMLKVAIVNTSSGDRYYGMDILLNPALLGHMDTGTADWRMSEIQLKPERKEFLNRLTQWAENLQQAATKAFEYDMPKDAFSGIPSFRTLMLVPADLAALKGSQGLVSAVTDLKTRANYKAIAYSVNNMGKSRWSRFYAHVTQSEADTKALSACDKDRPSDLPPCRLFPL